MNLPISGAGDNHMKQNSNYLEFIRFFSVVLAIDKNRKKKIGDNNLKRPHLSFLG